MIHISDPSADAGDNKLFKIQQLVDHICSISKELYQAEVNISVDERMVKSKARSGIRQFIANKPV